MMLESRGKLSMQEVIGGGYGDFWKTKKRYVVCKGSRASKKSKTAALWHIVKIMKHPGANALVIRKTERTLRDSCFADLKWAIHRLGYDSKWKAKTNPLELVYETGQKILFRGLDDPLKLTSISVETGAICFLWIEEAYELNNQDDFDYIDECIRGRLPKGLWKRVTITFNPWNDRHWLKKRFFDAEDKTDILAMTTNYMCNEWLDEADLQLFENMKKNNPRRYKVAGLGEWGAVDGLVYDNFEERFFDLEDIKQISDIKSAFGLDFGYTNDPTALFCGMISKERKEIYVFDEIYQKGMSNEQIFERIEKLGYRKERIIADAAEPKSIDRLRTLGLVRVRAARKGKDSVLAGIDFLQDFKIIVHPRCTNFLTEISNYSWDKDKFGQQINRPVDDFNHLMDAMRYALEEHMRTAAYSFD
ncbi:PBSX family phage terminase large subunit [bacterium]|nr:PBSX family phage terminase large subunit [Elusimicrobiota bacterium]MBR6301157.1 PBSX family phage terminase large subunit [bacterium]